MRDRQYLKDKAYIVSITDETPNDLTNKKLQTSYSIIA